MFVDIENPKSPLKIANILMAYDKGVVIKSVRQPKEKLTPKVCFDILKSTNYPRCIRDVLQLIAKLPDEEQVQFKDVVLACFDNREQPEPIFQLGQEIAEKSGYGIELAKLKKINEGPYLFSEADAQKCYMCFKSEFTDEDFSAYDKVMFLSDKKIQFGKDVKFPKNMEILNSSDVSFSDEFGWWACNLLGGQSIRFKDGAKVNLWKAENLPANIDVSCCDEVDLGDCDLSEQPNLRFKEGASVDLSGAKNLPPHLDFSMCDVVDLGWCDLSEQPNLRFKDGAKVYLGYAKNLPENLDFSCCDEVDLSGCDLKDQTHLCFKKGAKVTLIRAGSLPHDMDVSQCDEVNLSYYKLERKSFTDGKEKMLWDVTNLMFPIDVSQCRKVDFSFCDLSHQPHLRFKDGAEVDLGQAQNLPKNLDVSNCSKVKLTGCDLSGQDNLCFMAGAMVNLKEAKNLPSHLDFSMCSEVYLDDYNYKSVKHLIFKNCEQMEKSGCILPDDWKGKIVFAEEQSGTSLNLDKTKNGVVSVLSDSRLGKFIGKLFGKDGR